MLFKIKNGLKSDKNMGSNDNVVFYTRPLTPWKVFCGRSLSVSLLELSRLLYEITMQGNVGTT